MTILTDKFDATVILSSFRQIEQDAHHIDLLDEERVSGVLSDITSL